MKLSELIEIAKTKPTTPIYLYPDNYTIFEDSDLQPTYIEDPEERLRSNYIKKWYDSDDCVGIQATDLCQFRNTDINNPRYEFERITGFTGFSASQLYGV